MHASGSRLARRRCFLACTAGISKAVSLTLKHPFSWHGRGRRGLVSFLFSPLGQLPIDVAIELERARRRSQEGPQTVTARLGDRFDALANEGGELAREQRARRLSAEFLPLVQVGRVLGALS